MRDNAAIRIPWVAALFSQSMYTNRCCGIVAQARIVIDCRTIATYNSR